MEISIDKIRIGNRTRKQLGDIAALANSIKDVGLLHPVVIDDNYNLIAGHRRILAHQYLGLSHIECKVAYEISDVIDILKAERDENVCRLDFAPSEAVKMASALEPLEREAAIKRQGMRTDLVFGEHGGNLPQSSQGKTRDKVAAAVGMSERTLKKAKEVIVAAEQEPEMFGDLVEKMDETGNVDGTYKEIIRRKREADIQQQREEITKSPLPINGLFDVICIDPPWPYGTKYDAEGRRAANPYPEMSLDSIAALKIPAAKDCVLWLWTTHKFMRHSFDLIDTWGFRDVAILTWAKDRIGLGSWLRSQSEFCIMAVKGSPTIQLTNQSTVLYGPLREHSRKPDEFYQMVDALCVGRKIDYFSREKREGWAQFGNDGERFNNEH